jgi:hypothetical protein
LLKYSFHFKLLFVRNKTHIKKSLSIPIDYTLKIYSFYIKDLTTASAKQAKAEKFCCLGEKQFFMVFKKNLPFSGHRDPC